MYLEIIFMYIQGTFHFRTLVLSSIMALVIATPNTLLAQVSDGGVPISFLKKGLTNNAIVPIIKLPEIDVKKLHEEDALAGEKSKIKKPFRYATMIPVNINLQNSGIWETFENGDKLWRIKIHSPKAYSIGINFNKYYLPPGATIFIYNEKKSKVLGAYTCKNNLDTKKLAIEPVEGSLVTIEYFEPYNAPFPGILSIDKVGHDYKGIHNYLPKSSGTCNVDVNCDEGSTWQKEKRAVCKITFNGYLCSGAMINNTSEDETPYFLTANHCINDQNDAENTIFFFNYEHTICNGSEIASTKSLSGGTLIATAPNGSLDFSLVKMSSTPPETYQPYYAGWSRETNAPTKGTCIHHPGGDVKKISIENEALETSNYGDGYDENSHWLVKAWDTGTTEGGSSGSPIFNQDYKIVGDLTGGDASCSNNFNDYFAKLSRSWADYSTEGQQLKHWLDPYSTGAYTLSGHDPYAPAGLKNAQMLSILSPLDSNFNSPNIAPQVIIQNKGSEALTSLDVSYQINNGAVVNIPWTGNLSFNETETITFPSIPVTGGDYVFKAFCSSPNGGVDENNYNDTLNLPYFVAFDLDVVLHSIIQPIQVYCSENSFEPKVVIKNLGNNLLTSVIVNYQINEGAVFSNPWTGNLVTLATDTVSFATTDMDNGDYSFKAFVSNPNEGSDLKPDNDTLEKNFSIKSGEVVRLSLTTDDYGDETSWSLENMAAELLYSGENYPNNTVITENFCLDPNCYRFTIFDTSNDGICCGYGTGGYILARVNDTFTDTIMTGGDFDHDEITEFCSPLLFVNFTSSSNSIVQMDTVQFTNLSNCNETTTYSWSFDGGTPALSTQKDPIVRYNDVGIFNVSLTITEGVRILTETKNNYIAVDSFKIENNKNIVVYPNPSYDGFVHIFTNAVAISAYKIYNTLGQIMQSGTVPESSFTLNMSGYRGGVYILKLNGGNQEFFHKILIIEK